MTALICGSFAYDHIMVFPGRFKDHILPEKIHMLNVCFVVPDMKREFGGCAGNIAYNMKLLGADCLPMGAVGEDFASYGAWLKRQGIDDKHIKIIDNTFTAQCFITTDLDDNQITAFQLGALTHAHENTVSAAEHIRIGIVAPDGKDGMLEHAEQFARQGTPFIFDPGQNVTVLNKAELISSFEHATWVTFNDYEWQLVESKTGLTTERLLEMIDALIVTRGAQGSTIYSKGKQIEIPAAKAKQVVDPTGCGDAYRAGLLYGLMNDMDWETTGRVAALMGALKIEVQGTQNHRFDEQAFVDQFKEDFGYSLSLK